MSAFTASDEKPMPIPRPGTLKRAAGELSVPRHDEQDDEVSDHSANSRDRFTDGLKKKKKSSRASASGTDSDTASDEDSRAARLVCHLAGGA